MKQVEEEESLDKLNKENIYQRITVLPSLFAFLVNNFFCKILIYSPPVHLFKEKYIKAIICSSSHCLKTNTWDSEKGSEEEIHFNIKQHFMQKLKKICKTR